MVRRLMPLKRFKIKLILDLDRNVIVILPIFFFITQELSWILALKYQGSGVFWVSKFWQYEGENLIPRK